MVAEAFGGVNRVPRVEPYIPARTEYLGTTADRTTINMNDVGKAVKMSGDAVVVCASGDDIYGVIESVEVGSTNGLRYGGVVCDVNAQFLAWDEAGTLAVGGLVVAGTAVAWGTAMPNGAPNVIAGAPAIHRWQVVAKYTAGSNAGKVLLRKV